MASELSNAERSPTTNLMLLSWHCFKKGVQLGAVLGNASILPIYFWKVYKSKATFDFSKVLRHQVTAMTLGTVLSMSLMTAKYSGWENKAECLKDRVYRISKNEGQVRTDIFAGAGFVCAFGVGFLSTGKLMKSLAISSFGISLGILGHVLTKQSAKKAE